MFDEVERLRAEPRLLGLLQHYAEPAATDRETWLRRLARLDGATAEELVRLHGELLAYEWVELNVGETPAGYRVTPAGLRALKRAPLAQDEPLAA
ncbi:MAG TPA: hypothetical protein VFA26_06940 [Gemmataceae bacterium]|nr:hypothetical protein [Gemmataceae bacterium]